MEKLANYKHILRIVNDFEILTLMVSKLHNDTEDLCGHREPTFCKGERAPVIYREKRIQCPICGSDDIVRSRRRAIEKCLQLFFYPRLPFRCRECWKRFRVFSNPFQSWAPRVAAGIIVLFFGLPLVLFHVYPFHPQDSRKSVNTDMEGLSKNVVRDKILLSRAHAKKILNSSDYKERAYPEKPFPGIREEISLRKMSEQIETTKEKIVSKKGKGEASSTKSGPPGLLRAPVDKVKKGQDIRKRDHTTKLYYLHVSSFKRKFRAENEVQRIKRHGYKAFIIPGFFPERKWFRVYIGEFDDEKEAQKMGSELRAKGIIFYFEPRIIDKDTLSSRKTQSQDH